MQAELPLFPLNLVLLPGAYLPLRIFEQRYLDMVRDAARDGSGFGVCLVTDTEPDTGAAQHARVGTRALIRDFYTLDDGLLGITAQGDARYRVTSTRVRSSGLLVAEVEWLPEPETVPLPVEYELLARIAENFMQQVQENYPDYRQEQLEDASWVGYRLTELLPMRDHEKQLLLEMNDPFQRLQALMEALPRFQKNSPGE
jgi:Lon protease-like protein